MKVLEILSEVEDITQTKYFKCYGIFNKYRTLMQEIDMQQTKTGKVEDVLYQKFSACKQEFDNLKKNLNDKGKVIEAFSNLFYDYTDTIRNYN